MFVKLKKLLEKRISRLGNKEQIELGLLSANWAEIIVLLVKDKENGEALYIELNTSKPIRLQNFALTIEVNNQACASELSLFGYELMDKINDYLKRRSVKRLFFRIKRS
jgi:hypothetical protein